MGDQLRFNIKTYEEIGVETLNPLVKTQTFSGTCIKEGYTYEDDKKGCSGLKIKIQKSHVGKI